MEVVVEDAAAVEEMEEWECGDAGVGGGVTEHGVEFGESGEGEGVEGAGGVDGVGDALCLGAGEEHDASGCGEDDCGVELCDGPGVGADVACDGLAGGIGAIGGEGECPDALGGEGVEWELSELSLGEGLCGGGECKDGCGADVEGEGCGEDEGVVDFGDVDGGWLEGVIVLGGGAFGLEGGEWYGGDGLGEGVGHEEGSVEEVVRDER